MVTLGGPGDVCPSHARAHQGLHDLDDYRARQRAHLRRRLRGQHERQPGDAPGAQSVVSGNPAPTTSDRSALLGAMHPDVFLGAHAGFFDLDGQASATTGRRNAQPVHRPEGLRRHGPAQREALPRAGRCRADDAGGQSHWLVTGDSRPRHGDCPPHESRGTVPIGASMDDLVQRRLKYIERQKTAAQGERRRRSVPRSR